MPTRPNALGRRHAAATGHPAATLAALDMLDGGGNAVDAACAAALVLAVVHPDLVTFFGVAAIMVRPAQTGRVATIAGLGGWPRAATLERFLSDYGGTIPEGLPRSVVPGAPGGWIAALRDFGTVGFAEVAQAAIGLARNGSPVTDHVAHSFAQYADKIATMPTSAALYFRDGRVPKLGDLLFLEQLAATLQYLADIDCAHRRDGRAAGLAAVEEAIYRGDIAEVIVRYHAENGGLLTREDMAGFVAERSTAFGVRLGSAVLAVCGPWCQGPSLAQLARLHDDQAGLTDPDSEPFIHRFAELTKLAMADRTAYFGDPLAVEVPTGALLDSDYAALRRALVGEDAIVGLPPPGDPLGMRALAPPIPFAMPSGEMPARANTSGIAVADAAGTVCAATVSDVAVDTPVISGLGCPVSSRGSQGWLDRRSPGVIGPGRRPWLTACPAIMTLDDGRILAIASAGGDVQPQAMLLTVLRMMRGDDPQSAIDAPRVESRSFPDSFWPHGFVPGRLRIESAFASARGRLEARGHRVEVVPDRDARLGAVVLAGTAPGGSRFAAADSRRDAAALAR
jgi:gamma-glutamyltranspeptidase/glutathione hydrolase